MRRRSAQSTASTGADLDSEIETWRKHNPTNSRGAILTSSGDHSSLSQKDFLDEKLPAAPVTAKAPNAREGLTDSTVPGEDAFVRPLRRNSSRLQKRPGSALGHRRSLSSFSDIMERPKTGTDRPKTAGEGRPVTPHTPVMEADEEVPDALPSLPAEPERKSHV
ncbi:MAG: hypothetical protein M1824_004911 [Vezdaea acicularis]|nr:MAG: hypothetical protein M1824_004911 [Vezdaea acicularis]